MNATQISTIPCDSESDDTNNFFSTNPWIIARRFRPFIVLFPETYVSLIQVRKVVFLAKTRSNAQKQSRTAELQKFKNKRKFDPNPNELIGVWVENFLHVSMFSLLVCIQGRLQSSSDYVAPTTNAVSFDRPPTRVVGSHSVELERTTDRQTGQCGADV
jgi:hypothetical protein